MKSVDLLLFVQAADDANRTARCTVMCFISNTYRIWKKPYDRMRPCANARSKDVTIIPWDVFFVCLKMLAIGLSQHQDLFSPKPSVCTSVYFHSVPFGSLGSFRVHGSWAQFQFGLLRRRPNTTIATMRIRNRNKNSIPTGKHSVDEDGCYFPSFFIIFFGGTKDEMFCCSGGLSHSSKSVGYSAENVVTGLPSTTIKKAGARAVAHNKRKNNERQKKKTVVRTRQSNNAWRAATKG